MPCRVPCCAGFTSIGSRTVAGTGGPAPQRTVPTSMSGALTTLLARLIGSRYCPPQVPRDWNGPAHLSMGDAMAAQCEVLGAGAHKQDPPSLLASAVTWGEGRAVEGGSDAVVRQHCDAARQVVDGRGRTRNPNLG
jgi:hypothetical protein